MTFAPKVENWEDKSKKFTKDLQKSFNKYGKEVKKDEQKRLNESQRFGSDSNRGGGQVAVVINRPNQGSDKNLADSPSK